MQVKKLIITLALLSWLNGSHAVMTDADGVRLFSASTPAPYVHPRVLFTESEKGELLDRIQNTTFGVKRLQPELKAAAERIRELGARISDVDPEHLAGWDFNELFQRDEALQQTWGVAALRAYLYDDRPLKDYLIDLSVKHACIILASREYAPDHWFWAPKSAGTDMTGDQAGYDWNLGHEWALGRGFSMTYDLLYNDMNESQRGVIRKAIAEAVRGRRSHGMGQPATLQFSNHSPLHGVLGVISLSIEGEEGYDPGIYEEWVDLLEGWLTLPITKGGANHEDGYIYYAMRGASAMMIAAQRRGEQLWNIPNGRNILKWQTHWEPVGLQGPNLGGYQTVHAAWKYMYPEDPFANMFWRRRVGAEYEQPLHWQSMIDTLLFGGDYDGDPILSGDPSSMNLPEYTWDARRGVMIARNGWDEKDLQFRFSARPDTMFVGHAAVDSGSFDLEALGRKWVYNNVGDKASSFSSKDFSLIHIDGQAEEMKPPTVQTLFSVDSPEAAVIAADLTYAYNWSWYYGWPTPHGTNDLKDGGQADVGMPGPPWEPELEDPYDLGWPAEDDWLPNDLSNQPDLGYVGIWQMKKRINTVDHAFRTAITVRGEFPYVLIIDDVKKDEEKHLYEWYLQLASDIALKLMNRNDIVLGEQAFDDHSGQMKSGGIVESNTPISPAGSKRLLVRFLEPFSEIPPTQSMFFDRPNFIDGARVEDHLYGWTYNRGDMKAAYGRRLVVPYRGVSGDFVVMLYPFKSTNDADNKEHWQGKPYGAEMPATYWNKDHDQLTVTLGDQVDVFSFLKRKDGRSRVTMKRNGIPVKINP